MRFSHAFPENILDNSEMEGLGWEADKIFSKTGICRRHVSGEGEFALDIAEKACLNLFRRFGMDKRGIDYLLYCTQSPDFVIPNNASILQHRLGLPTSLASLDINQGCTGFVYGLSLSKGLLLSGQSRNLLLVTSDTYTKYIHPDDRSTRSIFGDGAAVVHLDVNDACAIGEFVFGTDGSGAENIIVRGSGLRHRATAGTSDEYGGGGGRDNYLYMNGPEVFTFALRRVPEAMREVLAANRLGIEDIDYFVFHQANAYMLEHLRVKLDIPKDKFPIIIKDTGNTVSSTIPLVLEGLSEDGRLAPGAKLLLMGFGVGYSWAGTVLSV